ncbi:MULTISPECIES: NAD(P)-binding oxidoreductase [unclassified Solwaraspora]|uniref:NAD(P)-dependent oxidoreductase n=1 Tax=unclassified Solwaraspora TaxID=2627926 RepID=UPI00248D32D0|nr:MULTISPECIES: NAD(P)-binding oxidoreductase [unclassified Solwaraspora]WBB97950.1 SDR family oxidoreductase [Solwaraspora sp. WMMA2059]WBC23491.1 SDR family oxidoreductase [Solwaraspora sp. WMMA2080]WJK34424.1 SDR family oxidoreductase [Solwaraspora sp. WMMA2065]
MQCFPDRVHRHPRRIDLEFHHRDSWTIEHTFAFPDHILADPELILSMGSRALAATTTGGAAMKVLVVGASGGSGRATVRELGHRGHEVTAFSRNATTVAGQVDGGLLRGVNGDATDPGDVDKAVRGQDAVIVTLGISENPVGVRLRGPAHTPLDVRSRGTGVVVEAMRRHGVRRLVVQTSYGVGPTRTHLPMLQRLVFWVLLRPQIVDTERQERIVRSSGLDWTAVQPVNLTDDDPAEPPFVSTTGATRSMKVARTQVAWLLAESVENDGHIGATLSLSAR